VFWRGRCYTNGDASRANAAHWETAQHDRGREMLLKLVNASRSLNERGLAPYCLAMSPSVMRELAGHVGSKDEDRQGHRNASATSRGGVEYRMHLS